MKALAHDPPGQFCGGRVLHVNLLKEWVQQPERKADVMLVSRVPEEQEVDKQYSSHAGKELWP